jgi:hypothetical protein
MLKPNFWCLRVEVEEKKYLVVDGNKHVIAYNTKKEAAGYFERSYELAHRRSYHAYPVACQRLAAGLLTRANVPHNADVCHNRTQSLRFLPFRLATCARQRVLGFWPWWSSRSSSNCSRSSLGGGSEGRMS